MEGGAEGGRKGRSENREAEGGREEGGKGVRGREAGGRGGGRAEGRKSRDTVD